MKKFIYSMFLVLATALVACTEDYKDWEQPQQNDQPEIVTFGNGSVSAVGLIDFATIAEGQTLVKVCNITAPTASSEDYKNTRYELHLDNGAVCDVTDNGEVLVEFLQTEVEQEFGKAPVERELNGYVEQWISNGATSVKAATSGRFVITAKLTAPVIEETYYFVGTSNNWDIADDTYKFNHSEQNVYDDPIFTVTVPAPCDENGERVDNWFKIVPKSCFDEGSWDGLLGCEIDGDESLEGQLIVGGQALKMPASDGAKFYKISINMMEYSYKIETVNFDEYIYFIGATDGWSKAEQRLALTDSDNGVYTGFLYCADPNGWGNAFKFQREPGNWDTQINANDFTTYSGAAENLGDNIGVSGGESVYYFTVNMSAGEISAVEVETMSLIGDFNGWSGDVMLTWNANAYCFEGDLSQVTDKGWKFRVNEDWAINLGGKSLNDLTQGGDNLKATGSTIQLYPTRRNNDKIYATVDGETAEDPEPGIDPSELTPFIYFIGATDGWANAEQKLALTDADNGVYTGFLYCADPNGWGNQFKFQKVAGDWGTELNTGNFSKFSGDAADPNNGGNIGVSGGEGVYYFCVNLGAGEIYAEEVKTMGIIGDFNGWSADLEMTWNAADYCFEANIAEVSGGWKFRLNGGWDTNLGGSLDNLVQNGDNLSATGTTCKLYPTRKTADNIYCVVE